MNNISPMDYFLKLDSDEIYNNIRGFVSEKQLSIIMNLLRAFKRKYAKITFDEFKKDLQMTGHDFSDLLFVLGEQITNNGSAHNPADDINDTDEIKEWMMEEKQNIS